MAKHKGKLKLARKVSGAPYREQIAPVRKDLASAYSAVGNTPAKRLKWLLELTNKELDEVSEGRRIDLGWEVVMFGINQKPDEIERDWNCFFRLAVLASPYTVEEIGKRNTKDFIQPKPSQAMVREFHSTMRSVFDQLFTRGYWDYQPASRPQRIALSIKGSDGAYQANYVRDLTADELLIACAFDLLKAEVARLGVCQNPNCKRRFVTLRKTIGKFCSPRCSAYVRVNRARGKL